MPAATIPALLEDITTRMPNQIAVIDTDVQMTWSELAERVESVARSLLALGVDAGDRVMLLGPNDHHWIQACLGAHMTGAVVVPVNTRYSGYEILDLIERTNTRVLMTVSGFLGHAYLEEVREAARTDRPLPSGSSTTPLPGVPALTAVVEWAQQPGTTTAVDEQVYNWADFLTLGAHVDRSEVVRRSAAVSPEDPADIVFTSGTTGRSKGAVSLHRHTVSCSVAWAENVRVNPSDNYLIVSPFAHTFGYKAGMLVCVATGATMVPMATFDTEVALDLIAKHEITIVPGAPTIFQMILDHPSRPAPESLKWRVAVTGSAIVPVRLVERIYEELDLESVITGYGLSEAVTVTLSAFDDPLERVVTSAGRAVADFKIRIRDEAGNELPPGESGEIEVCGPNVMVGYLDDEEATRSAIAEDGWLRTGDVGILSEDGYLTITDRIKDMFTVGGFNVYPAEVEHVLSRLQGVRESSVIGVSDKRLGSVGKVFVIRSEDAFVTEEDVTNHLSRRLAKFKVPKFVSFVEDLPRNHAGKVLKRDLVAREEREEASSNAPTDPR